MYKFEGTGLDRWVFEGRYVWREEPRRERQISAREQLCQDEATSRIRAAARDEYDAMIRRDVADDRCALRRRRR